MTHDAFINAIQQTFDDALALLKAKNHDYATETDPFKNFRFSEMVGASVDLAILVRMSDKLARVANLRTQAAVIADESIQDTLIDLCNYAAILKVYLDEKKKA